MSPCGEEIILTFSTNMNTLRCGNPTERFELQTNYSGDLSKGWLGQEEIVGEVSWKSLRAEGLRSEVTGIGKKGTHWHTFLE